MDFLLLCLLLILLAQQFHAGITADMNKHLPVTRSFCSPKGILCLKLQNLVHLGPYRSQIGFDISYYGKILLPNINFTITHASRAIEVERPEFSFFKNSSDSWRPHGGAQELYHAFYNKLDLKVHHTTILELKIFDETFGAKIRSSQTNDLKRFEIQFGFLDDLNGTAYLDGGNERGYFFAGFSQKTVFSWSNAAQAVPVSFEVSEGANKKKHYISFLEACNNNAKNLKLIPKNVQRSEKSKVLTFYPRDGFSAIFEDLTYRSYSPYFVFHFAESVANLGNRFGSAGLLCPRPVGEFSFAKPGKAIREITLTTEGAIKLSRICSRFGIRYVLFDAGWYGPEGDPTSDPTNPKPSNHKNPIDLKQVIHFGASISPPVFYIFYVNDIVLQNFSKVEKIAAYLKGFGASGIKMGFVNATSSSEMARVVTNMQIFGKYELIVNIHDNFRDYYLQRTYPYLLSTEGVRGSEHRTDEVLNQLTLPFTRMLAGRMDHTFTDSKESLEYHGNITLLYEISLPFILYNGITHLFWYDSWDQIEEKIRRTSLYKLWHLLPESFSYSRFLDCEIGSHLSIVRQSVVDGSWFLIAITDKPRVFNFDLDFLNETKRYSATAYRETGITHFPLHSLTNRTFKQKVGERSAFVLHLEASITFSRSQFTIRSS